MSDLSSIATMASPELGIIKEVAEPAFKFQESVVRGGQNLVEKSLPVLTDYWKFVIKAVGIGFIVVIVVLLIRFLVKQSQQTAGINREINRSELSYSTAEFEIKKQQLVQAMAAAGPYFTDENEVYRILNSLKNSSDWYELVKVFGEVNGKKLVPYLLYELSTNQYAKVLEILNKIGVTS